ncbi:MAG: hypothetical protein ABI082_01320 [Dokdonella sp.]
MVTFATIEEIRRGDSVSSLDAVHALSVSQGDTRRAIDYLRTERFGTKSLCVTGSEIAARLAAQLIGTGLWFECEQLDREKWRFAVAPACYARLIVLHRMLMCSRNAR